MALYRHGDVLIGAVETLPENARKRPHLVLAYGEITGHSHRIEDSKTAETFELDGVLYLKVIAPVARLIHEEHAAIELPEGVYRVWQQREYTPERIRTVYD
jgi:hypothetical protein